MNSPNVTAEAVGFPIQRSPDQSLLSSSPKHIAACHVFHRLLVPRHPPNALSSLLYAILLTRKTQAYARIFLCSEDEVLLRLRFNDLKFMSCDTNLKT